MKDLPSMAECASTGTGLPPPRQPNSPLRILVVDDDRGILQLNTEVLQHSGYEVDSAADGAAAWEALQLKPYDLMITDNNMPKLTGFELLQKLRAAHIVLPVIVASGTFFSPEAAPTPWCQPEAALLKPYTIEALLRVVEKVFAEARLAASRPEFAAPKLHENAVSTPVVLRPESDAAPRILVVEKDSDLRQMYSEILAGPGYRVDGVADGADGWAALQSNPYELLITEQHLPKLTGVELVRKVRAAQLTLPIVMTADRLPMPEMVGDPALSLAATLMKPFAIDALLSVVKAALRRPRGAATSIALAANGTLGDPCA